jgi:hypothetical protein
MKIEEAILDKIIEANYMVVEATDKYVTLATSTWGGPDKQFLGIRELEELEEILDADFRGMSCGYPILQWRSYGKEV